MTKSNKQLGIAAMISAPFLSLHIYIETSAVSYNPSLGGRFDLLYMFGWMCSIPGLLRLRITCTKKGITTLLHVQLALLCVANSWNIWVIFDPACKSTIFLILDMFWPLSNVCLLLIGITIALFSNLKGCKRFAGLLAGLWLPLMLLIGAIIGKNSTSLIIGSVYSTVTWALFGWMIYTSNTPEREKPDLAF